MFLKYYSLKEDVDKLPIHTSSIANTCWTLIALLQSGLGHHLEQYLASIFCQYLSSSIVLILHVVHLMSLLHCTKLSVISCWYFTLTLGSSSRLITWVLVFSCVHLWCQHHHLVVHNDLAVTRAFYHLASTLLHYLHSQVPEQYAY